MHHLLRAAVLFSLTLAFAACGETLRPIETVAITPPLGATAEQIASAIKKAGVIRNWTMKDVAPGKIEGELKNRRHYVKVLIEYDTKAYSVQYRESKNMGFNGIRIHWKYRDWVQNLRYSIRREVSKI